MTKVSTIIEAIITDYFGDDDPCGIVNKNGFGIKYERFVKILGNPKNPLFNSDRTIREKWKYLHNLGYLTKINQYTSKIELELICTDFYDWELKKIMEKSGE